MSEPVDVDVDVDVDVPVEEEGQKYDGGEIPTDDAPAEEKEDE